MSSTMLRHWLIVSALLAFICALALPAMAADQAQDIAARALLGEAEKLLELGQAQDALVVTEQVLAKYPDSGIAPWAQLRQALALMFLDRYDESIALSRTLVSQHQGSMLACWAQCYLGEALIRQGQSSQGVKELFKVRYMLFDQSDLGPYNYAYGVIGRVYDQYLKGNDYSDSQIDSALGISGTDKPTKAKALAILAAFRGMQGRIDLANPLLDRVAAECPDQVDELKWAKAQVMIGYLNSPGSDPKLLNPAALDLNAVVSSDGIVGDAAVRAYLSLAKYYKKQGDVQSAINLLQTALQKFPCASAEVEARYELGAVLNRAGRAGEAVEVFRKIADDMGLSGYAAPSLYAAGMYAPERVVAIESFTKLAQGGYDSRWRALAYWRLGGLYKSTDKTRAIECFNGAITIYNECLETQKGDLRPDWRDWINADISLIQEEIQSLQAEEQEVQE